MPADLAWDPLVALASETLVAGELFEALSLQAQPMPEDVATFLREVVQRVGARNQRLFAAFEAALAALNQAGVAPLLLKGCATWVEGSTLSAPTRPRLTSDLDLVVETAMFGPAALALQQAGFSVLEDHQTQTHPVIVLGRRGDAGSIDLHCGAPFKTTSPAFAHLFATATPVRCGALVARRALPHFELVMTMLHDQWHFWRGGFDLRHLLDARLLCAAAEVDWEGFWELARATRATGLAGAWVEAARVLFEVNAPPPPWPGRLHFERQRLQQIWPGLNRSAGRLGLGHLLRGALAASRR
jgi:hypothetical protein